MASIAKSWTPQGTFHHVGYVVDSIPNTVNAIAKSLDAEWDGEVIHDPLQSVRVTFLKHKNPTDPLVELVEPAGEKSPVQAFLKRGGGLHHLCYQVEQLEEQL